MTKRGAAVSVVTTARPVGALNLGMMTPSFCLPVFAGHDARSAVRLVQAVDGQGKVEAFVPLGESDGVILPCRYEKKTVRVGEPAVYAFALTAKQVFMGTRWLLSAILRERMRDLFAYPFAALEVGRFSRDESATRRALLSCGQSLRAVAPEAGERWLSREQEQTVAERPRLAERPLHFDTLFRELEQLLAVYGEIFVRLRLMRSTIGTSPMTRRTLEAFGLTMRHVNHETPRVSIDVARLRALRKVRHLVMVVEAVAFGSKEVRIVATDEGRLRQRHFGKHSGRQRVLVSTVTEYVYQMEVW